MDSFYYNPKMNMRDMNKCLDMEEYVKWFDEISQDKTFSLEQKNFLKILATRFILFKYEKLADFYASTDKRMQTWLEKLRCVIVDTDTAIKSGYFEYADDYSELLKEIVNE